METAGTHFKNRQEAGEKLAEKLTSLQTENPYVFALPRGGVPVAAPIARRLQRPLDLLLVNRIPAPSHPELAIGAIAEDGDPVWQEKKISFLNISKPELNRLVVKAQQSLARQRRLWMKKSHFSELKNKTVILVDDGMATGSTLLAALDFLRKRNPRKVIVAIPVGSRSAIQKISEVVDEVICLTSTDEINPISQVYEDSTQVPDRLISEILDRERKTFENAKKYSPRPDHQRNP